MQLQNTEITDTELKKLSCKQYNNLLLTFKFHSAEEVKHVMYGKHEKHETRMLKAAHVRISTIV